MQLGGLALESIFKPPATLGFLKELAKVFMRQQYSISTGSPCNMSTLGLVISRELNPDTVLIEECVGVY